MRGHVTPQECLLQGAFNPVFKVIDYEGLPAAEAVLVKTCNVLE